MKYLVHFLRFSCNIHESEYAAFLGMDPVKHSDLMWLAKEGLKV